MPKDNEEDKKEEKKEAKTRGDPVVYLKEEE